MKWKKGRDRDGKIQERVAVSDAGYTVARFTVNGAELYRASTKGEFICWPTTDPKEAQRACERHSASKQ